MFHNRRQLIAVSRRPYVAAGAAYSGPGNVVGSAIAWWGLRAYTSASIGANAVRLRESGGNTEQDFVTIAGGGLDLAAIATFKGANNLFVRTLYDQVGSAHMTQTASTLQPQFILSGVGSLPVIRLLSAGSLTMSATLTQSQPLTMSVFAKRTANFTTNTFMIGDANCTLGYKNAVNQLDAYAGGSDVFAAATDSAFHAIQFAATGSSSDINVDGTPTTPLNPGTGGVTTLRLSGIFGSSVDADLTECGIWGSAFNGTQSTNMSSNQHTYWGV